MDVENDNKLLVEILEGLKYLIEKYNDTVAPNQRVRLSCEGEKKDVSDIFICVYNKNCVGLFRKINWNSDYYYKYISKCYEAGSIYVGVDSDYIGMKKTHSDSIEVNYWEEIGARVDLKSGTYIANCSMKNGMSFDDMRLIMYKNNKIGPYTLGESSPQEMLDVLKFAMSYYQLTSGYSKRK